jgi:hypothetical protein
MLAHNDVGGLQVAVNHAAGMSVVDGVADVEKVSEEFAECQVSAAGRPTTLTLPRKVGG